MEDPQGNSLAAIVIDKTTIKEQVAASTKVDLHQVETEEVETLACLVATLTAILMEWAMEVVSSKAHQCKLHSRPQLKEVVAVAAI